VIYVDNFTTVDFILFGVVVALGIFCSAMSALKVKPSPKTETTPEEPLKKDDS
jgi:hypothetical protein